MGLLQGPRLMARTTKSPIRRNHWVPLGCRGHLGSVKGIKPSKMVRFEVFKTPDDSIYIASCPVRGKIRLRLQFPARN